MFSALHTLAARAALHLLIVAEGERLRITLQPKATGDAPPPPPLQLVATPAEFDAGFVDAVAAYQAPVVSLIEQAGAAAASVAEAATKAAEAKPAKADKPTKKAKTLRERPIRGVAGVERAAAASKAREEAAAARAEKRRQAEERAAQAAAEKKARAEAKKADREAQRAAARQRKAAAKTAPTDPAPGEVESARAACIADVRGYLALAAGAKPSRGAFLATMPPTGRRYERLFASFDELVAAAQQQEPPIAETPAAPAADHVADAGKMIDGATTPDDNGQSASQTGEPVTLANMEAPPPQATEGLFSGEPQLDGDAAPAGEINGAAAGAVASHQAAESPVDRSSQHPDGSVSSGSPTSHAAAPPPQDIDLPGTTTPEQAIAQAHAQRDERAPPPVHAPVHAPVHQGLAPLPAALNLI